MFSGSYGWKYAYSSVSGTSHRNKGIPCQDSCFCSIVLNHQNEPVLAAAASDGAGSAKFAQIGSCLAAAVIMDELKTFIEGGNDISDFTFQMAEEIVIEIQRQISIYANACGCSSNDFLCTVLGCMIGPECAALFQIGDGAMVVSTMENPENFTLLFWPMNGEYENTTYFASDEIPASSILHFKLIKDSIDKVAVFTDGIQRLALHYKDQTAHAPFFKPLFSYLNQIPCECSNTFLDSLSSFF